jgi:hypothetical protein
MPVACSDLDHVAAFPFVAGFLHFLYCISPLTVSFPKLPIMDNQRRFGNNVLCDECVLCSRGPNVVFRLGLLIEPTDMHVGPPPFDAAQSVIDDNGVPWTKALGNTVRYRRASSLPSGDVADAVSLDDMDLATTAISNAEWNSGVPPSVIPFLDPAKQGCDFVRFGVTPGGLPMCWIPHRDTGCVNCRTACHLDTFPDHRGDGSSPNPEMVPEPEPDSTALQCLVGAAAFALNCPDHAVSIEFPIVDDDSDGAGAGAGANKRVEALIHAPVSSDDALASLLVQGFLLEAGFQCTDDDDDQTNTNTNTNTNTGDNRNRTTIPKFTNPCVTIEVNLCLTARLYPTSPVTVIVVPRPIGHLAGSTGCSVKDMCPRQCPEGFRTSMHIPKSSDTMLLGLAGTIRGCGPSVGAAVSDVALRIIACDRAAVSMDPPTVVTSSPQSSDAQTTSSVGPRATATAAVAVRHAPALAVQVMHHSNACSTECDVTNDDGCRKASAMQRRSCSDSTVRIVVETADSRLAAFRLAQKLDTINRFPVASFGATNPWEELSFNSTYVVPVPVLVHAETNVTLGPVSQAASFNAAVVRFRQAHLNLSDVSDALISDPSPDSWSARNHHTVCSALCTANTRAAVLPQFVMVTSTSRAKPTPTWRVRTVVAAVATLRIVPTQAPESKLLCDALRAHEAAYDDIADELARPGGTIMAAAETMVRLSSRCVSDSNILEERRLESNLMEACANGEVVVRVGVGSMGDAGTSEFARSGFIPVDPVVINGPCETEDGGAPAMMHLPGVRGDPTDAGGCLDHTSKLEQTALLWWLLGSACVEVHRLNELVAGGTVFSVLTTSDVDTATAAHCEHTRPATAAEIKAGVSVLTAASSGDVAFTVTVYRSPDPTDQHVRFSSVLSPYVNTRSVLMLPEWCHDPYQHDYSTASRAIVLRLAVTPTSPELKLSQMVTREAHTRRGQPAPKIRPRLVPAGKPASPGCARDLEILVAVSACHVQALPPCSTGLPLQTVLGPWIPEWSPDFHTRPKPHVEVFIPPPRGRLGASAAAKALPRHKDKGSGGECPAATSAITGTATTSTDKPRPGSHCYADDTVGCGAAATPVPGFKSKSKTKNKSKGKTKGKTKTKVRTHKHKDLSMTASGVADSLVAVSNDSGADESPKPRQCKLSTPSVVQHTKCQRSVVFIDKRLGRPAEFESDSILELGAFADSIVNDVPNLWWKTHRLNTNNQRIASPSSLRLLDCKRKRSIIPSR